MQKFLCQANNWPTIIAFSLLLYGAACSIVFTNSFGVRDWMDQTPGYKFILAQLQ